MKLLSFLLLLACAANSSNVNVTKIIIPEIVPKEQLYAELECHYEPEFDRFHYFKNTIEIFRYDKNTGKYLIFPPEGIGNITVVKCDTTSCIIRLMNLTEAASAIYKCEVERFNPSYEYSYLGDYMKVNRNYAVHNKRPVVLLSASLYGEGDEIVANCSGTTSMIKWYINKEERNEWNGAQLLILNSTRSLFSGSPPAIIVQCASMRQNGFLLGSRGAIAYWKQSEADQRPQEQRNSADDHKYSIFYVISFLAVVIHIANVGKIVW